MIVPTDCSEKSPFTSKMLTKVKTIIMMDKITIGFSSTRYLQTKTAFSKVESQFILCFWVTSFRYSELYC